MKSGLQGLCRSKNRVPSQRPDKLGQEHMVPSRLTEAVVLNFSGILDSFGNTKIKIVDFLLRKIHVHRYLCIPF